MIRALAQKYGRGGCKLSAPSVLKRTSRHFCHRSTLHGFKYLVQPATNVDNDHRSSLGKSQAGSLQLCGRMLWLAVCLLGVGLTLYLVQQVGGKYLTTPTITTIHSSNYPIWKVHFPAVSLCNLNKVYGPATADIREKLYASCSFLCRCEKN